MRLRLLLRSGCSDFHHHGRRRYQPRPFACHSGAVKMAACSKMSEREKERNAHQHQHLHHYHGEPRSCCHFRTTLLQKPSTIQTGVWRISSVYRQSWWCWWTRRRKMSCC